ncbi:PDZK1-interacting protein 1 isoform X2 [Kryptolebias marmoratus]|uniref:PDZK1-interacting protein 1 isoform X2 n=1 Tax=Kryptolebias marmoratus TaxID=37003 RepID=UPI0007F93994|nr:PDZK1-interacting protein 1 isoform X2 [Kryptolebias marmoratus]
MGKGSAQTFCSLLLIGTVTAQTALTPSSERLLPQWLTGLIAVSSFLLLTFIGFVVKRMWCEKSSRIPSVESVRENQYVERNPYDTKLDVLRSNSVESKKDNHYEMCDEYETSLDVLRKQSRRNIYDNTITDLTEDKSTAM